jgi:2,4-dienoyl-CoA reductase-like NADH-dependent reductase (Old Yellow Enzyme family)
LGFSLAGPGIFKYYQVFIQNTGGMQRMKSQPHDPGVFDGTLETPVLLTPLIIRSVTTRNRIVVSPMCQYSATNGMADDWHLVHLGSRAAGGAGIVIVEATAVTAEGRISPGDLGFWSDQQIEPLARIARFVTRMGAIPAIQLAHAGRKASVAPPFKGGVSLHKPEEGGWPIVGPSAVPFADGYQVPRELDKNGIHAVVDAFIAAARRAIKAEFKIIELHFAHGYLVHQFLSPLSNRRTDEYGGSLENRMRLALDLTRQVRTVMPETMPLFVRISATDWAEGGWNLEQAVALARALKPLGVDVVDTSSGGLVAGVKIPIAPNYQVPFAAAIRKQGDIMTGAVGMITEPVQANNIIHCGDADLVFLAKQMLRDPYWALHAAQEFEQEAPWPIQYGYAVRRLQASKPAPKGGATR